MSRFNFLRELAYQVWPKLYKKIRKFNDSYLVKTEMF